MNSTSKYRVAVAKCIHEYMFWCLTVECVFVYRVWWLAKYIQQILQSITDSRYYKIELENEDFIRH